LSTGNLFRNRRDSCAGDGRPSCDRPIIGHDRGDAAAAFLLPDAQRVRAPKLRSLLFGKSPRATFYGGARPDVGAVYGDRFAGSGYGIHVTGLPPGTYDIAVFAFSTVVNDFTPARVVRVVVQ
jgi:hypothetical protein